MPDKISELIKQNKFENLNQKILIGVMLLNNHFEEIQSITLRKYNLSLQQYNVLRILRGQYPQTCTLLLVKERMIDRMSDVSRIVERLRNNNLLTRDSNAADRRAVDIKITEYGLDLLKKIDQETDVFYKPMEKLSREEAITLLNLIEKLL